jgi:lipopolysaccharide/colanic/teichoic acid biosynthesis glycosyltransferase
MGFVGPRPERPEFYQKVREDIPLFPLRTLIKPGITGWAQVFAGYAGSVEESRVKLEFDLFYLQNMSPRMDIIVLGKTVAVAIKGEERNETPQQILGGESELRRA